MADKITGLLGDYRPVNERIKDVPGALRRYMQKSLLLDSPEMTGGETAADIALGFVPGVGTAMGARDFERARRDGDGLGMALGAAGMLPVVGGLLGKSARLMDRAKDGADLSRVVPQISGRGKAAAESQMLRQSLKADADPAKSTSSSTSTFTI
jgi:hypothetical protein